MKSKKLTSETKEKWLKIVTNDFMSSEESADDDSVVIRPLSWRAPCVDHMFQKIDEFNMSKKSGQSKRQTKSRKKGFLSERPKPVVDTDSSKWAFSS